jgi:hypothetical protein
MHMFRTSNGLASEQQSVWCLHIGTYQQASNNQQTGVLSTVNRCRGQWFW